MTTAVYEWVERPIMDIKAGDIIRRLDGVARVEVCAVRTAPADLTAPLGVVEIINRYDEAVTFPRFERVCRWEQINPEVSWVEVPAGELREGDAIRAAVDVLALNREDEETRGKLTVYLSDGGALWMDSATPIERRTDADTPRFTSVKRSGGCFHMIAREDETRWQRWWRLTVIARRHRKCEGGS